MNKALMFFNVLVKLVFYLKYIISYLHIRKSK